MLSNDRVDQCSDSNVGFGLRRKAHWRLRVKHKPCWHKPHASLRDADTIPSDSFSECKLSIVIVGTHTTCFAINVALNIGAIVLPVDDIVMIPKPLAVVSPLDIGIP